MILLYVLNSLIVPVSTTEEHLVKIRGCSVDEAASLLRANAYVSAVGHGATAAGLSTLLGVAIPENRISVHLTKGDRAIHVVLRQRLPEGKVLTRAELDAIGYDLALSEVLS